MGGNRLNSIDAGFKQTWLWIPTLFPLISYLTLALVSLTTKWYPHPSPTMLCLRITIAVPPQPTLSVALILKSCNIKNFWDFVKANACIPSYEKKTKTRLTWPSFHHLWTNTSPFGFSLPNSWSYGSIPTEFLKSGVEAGDRWAPG